MGASGDEAEVVVWFGVTGEGERAHRGWPPVEFLLSNGECIPFHCYSCVKLKGTLAVVRSTTDHGLYEWSIVADAVCLIKQLILGLSFGEDSGAVLEFVAVVEEEAAVVGAEGISGDDAGAATEGAAEVVPPGLAEVVAIGEGGAGDGADAGVDGFQVEGLVGRWVAGQLEV